MRKYISEFLGAFFLVLMGTGVIVVRELTGKFGTVEIALTFGFVITALIYAFGDISGAHFNPAVTLAFASLGKLNKKEIFPYIIAQITGAITGSFTVKFLFPASKGLGMTGPSFGVSQAFVFEFLLTLFLMLVILGVSTGSKEKGILAGIAIGFTIAVEAMFGDLVTGASMNPARSIGPAVAMMNFQHLWLYIAAPILGALGAAGIYNYLLKEKIE